MVPIRVKLGYIGVIWGITEKNMETTIMVYRGGYQNDGPMIVGRVGLCKF